MEREDTVRKQSTGEQRELRVREKMRERRPSGCCCCLCWDNSRTQQCFGSVCYWNTHNAGFFVDGWSSVGASTEVKCGSSGARTYTHSTASTFEMRASDCCKWWRGKVEAPVGGKRKEEPLDWCCLAMFGVFDNQQFSELHNCSYQICTRKILFQVHRFF